MDDVNEMKDKLQNEIKNTYFELAKASNFIVDKRNQSLIKKLSHKLSNTIDELSKYYNSEVEFYKTEYGEYNRKHFYSKNDFTMYKGISETFYFSVCKFNDKTKKLVHDILKYYSNNYYYKSYQAQCVNFLDNEDFIICKLIKHEDLYVLLLDDDCTEIFSTTDFDSIFEITKMVYYNIGMYNE